MRALLFVIGLLLVAAGIIIGVTSFLSPGEVILGLNLGLAATLLIGGFIVIALSAVVGAIDNLAGSIMPMINNQMIRETSRPEPAVSAGTVAAAATAAGAATAAAGVVAATSASATDAVADTAVDTFQAAARALEPEVPAVSPTIESAIETIAAPVADVVDAPTAEVEVADLSAVETEIGGERKPLGIDDVQLDRSGDGSPVLSERFAEPVEDVAPELPEDTSVAARIGAITAGVKAAAESGADKFEEVSETVGETLDGAADTVGDKVETVTEVIEEAPAAVIETAQAGVESIAETTDSVTETAAKLVEDAAEETPSLTDVAEAVQETEVVEDAEAAAGFVFTENADQIEPDVPEVVEEPPVEIEDAKAEEAEAVEEIKEAEDAKEIEEAKEPEDAEEVEVAKEPEDAKEAEEAQEDPTTASPEEGALYVVEETTVRERPARLLSDGTVEAETDAGWMRFENMDHLNEYLDAMSS